MEKEKLKEIIENTIVEYIAVQVVEKIFEKKKKALVLFTGASIGFRQSIESLNQLKEEGWELTVVMSRAAERVLGQSLIKSELLLDTIITEDSDTDSHVLAKDFEFILIPSLTINTSAKIANCIGDNLIADTIAYGLQKGKSIIASTDACCPENEERKQLGFAPTEAYKKRILENLQIMQDFGIQLTSSEGLAEQGKKALYKSMNPNKGRATQKPEQIDRANEVVVKKVVRVREHIISRKIILANAKMDKIIIKKNAVVTDLAMDEARKINMEIIKE